MSVYEFNLDDNLLLSHCAGKVTDNIHGVTNNTKKKEVRKQERKVDQWKATKRAIKTLSGEEHISRAH